MTPRTPGPLPPTLRSRLVLSFMALALGVVVVAGGVTVAFARANAREAAREDLQRQGAILAPILSDVSLPRVRGLIPLLRIEDAALIRIGRAGSVVGPLPRGISVEDLHVESLRAGEQVTGGSGPLVFVVQPFDPARPPRGAPPRGDEAEAIPALVLTRHTRGVDLGGLGPWLVVAGAVALAVAAVIGVLLARRLTRPLAATQRAARAVAAGDLSARVGAAGQADRELAEVAQAFDDMVEELEHSRTLSRDFLMSVSHDLRTPLTSIRGYAEALSEGTIRREPERRRAAGIIEGEARRLERLVSDLLDLARLDARRFRLEPRPTDVAAVAAATASGLEHLAHDLGVRLDVETSPTAERDLDPERLGQVVANLVENALKFATSHVKVTAAEDGAGVVVEVADDGPGIPPDDLPRVFDRLYTTRAASGDAAPRAVGTGLGLAIVHELVSAMEGTVEAGSPPEGGARLTVRFPAGKP